MSTFSIPHLPRYSDYLLDALRLCPHATLHLRGQRSGTCRVFLRTSFPFNRQHLCPTKGGLRLSLKRADDRCHMFEAIRNHALLIVLHNCSEYTCTGFTQYYRFVFSQAQLSLVLQSGKPSLEVAFNSPRPFSCAGIRVWNAAR